MKNIKTMVDISIIQRIKRVPWHLFRGHPVNIYGKYYDNDSYFVINDFWLFSNWIQWFIKILGISSILLNSNIFINRKGANSSVIKIKNNWKNRWPISDAVQVLFWQNMISMCKLYNNACLWENLFTEKLGIRLAKNPWVLYLNISHWSKQG